MAYQNPGMDALTSGGQMANQGMSVANSMMMGVQKAMDSASDLTFKMTNLLKNEEAKKIEQSLQLNKQMQDQYQAELTNKMQNERTAVMNRNAATSEGQLELGQDKYKLDRFKTVAGLVGDFNTSGKMDDKVYDNKLNTLKARATTINGISSEDFAGFSNTSKENALWGINEEIKALQTAYNTQGQGSGLTTGGVPKEMINIFNSAAKDAGFPSLGTPTTTPQANVSGTPVTAPSTLGFDDQGNQIIPEGFVGPQKNLGEIYDNATGGNNSVPQTPPGINPRLYDYNTIVSTMAGEPAKMLQAYEKGVKPIISGYKKMYPEKWAGMVSNDPRVTNPMIAGLSSNSPKVVNATENNIRNMGMNQKQTDRFYTNLEYKYDKQVAPTIHYTNKGKDGGTWDYAKPAEKAPLPRRWNSNTEHTLQYLEPEHLDALRQYALGGSEVSDAFMKAGSWLGITKDSFSTNTAFSHLAKQVGAKTMNEEGVSVVSTAAWALENISKQAWGDDTQPFKFGSGIWSYSGVSERINDKNSITTSTGDKNPIYHYLIPEQIGGDTKVETSDMSPKARYKLYEQYKNGQKEMTDVKKEQYRHNALMLTREINKYKEDKGYQEGDSFYADIDGMINTTIWNMHTNKLEQVQLSVEKAGLMLGAMVAPMANMASH